MSEVENPLVRLVPYLSIWEHINGGKYLVVGYAIRKDSENDENVIIYKKLYVGLKEEEYWKRNIQYTRRVQNFLERFKGPLYVYSKDQE